MLLTRPQGIIMATMVSLYTIIVIIILSSSYFHRDHRSRAELARNNESLTEFQVLAAALICPSHGIQYVR